MTTARRSRILIITRNLPPLVGGMEQLNWHMAEQLSRIAEVRIVGPAGSAALAPAGIAIREASLQPLWRFLWQARRLARREARHWKPDIVLAGSGLTAPLAQSAARACGANTAVYAHGLDVAVNNLVYRALCLPAIRSVHRVIANSNATAELCRDIGVAPSRIGIVHPGVDLPADLPSPSGRWRREALGEGSHADGTITDVRTRYKFGNRPLLLSVGRLTHRKGLREFVTQCLPRIVAVQADIMLLVVGEAPTQSLHAQAQTPASIQAAADAVGLGNNVRFLGVITDRERLASIYASADVHVFPVRTIPGDPEGFGMVAIEAAAHGLPTVAFSTGGVVDAVSEGQSGHLITPGDYAAFADAVLQTLADRNALRASCITFAQRFAWPNFGVQINAQLSDMKASPHSSGSLRR